MDALSNVFSTVGNFMSGAGGKLLQTGLGGMDVVSKIMNQRRMAADLSAADAQQKKIAAMVANPSQLAAKAASMAEPLNQSLTRDVTDTTLADLTQRGLDPRNAPGISQAAVSSALAPYYNNNLQQAMTQYLQTLGLPYEQALMMARTYGQSTPDTTGFWDMFKMQDPSLDTSQNVYGVGPDVNVPNPSNGSTPPLTPPSIFADTLPPYALPAWGGASQ